jgi:adenosylcobyric acid synthase
VEARVAARPAAGVLAAYEIHMGVTESRGAGAPAFAIISRNRAPLQVADGWVRADRRVWGTYLHGLYDNDAFRRVFLEELRQESPAGPGASPEMSYADFQETQLDRLAELLRRHLDLAQIFTLIQPETT